MIPFLLERPFACVNSFMVDPGCTICKGSITELTFEGALSCVDTHVTLEGLFLRAAAPTHRTNKGFVPVQSHMSLQAFHAHKPVVTHLTFKILFCEMYSHMTLDKQISQMSAMSTVTF
jgi:hypothetical protein